MSLREGLPMEMHSKSQLAARLPRLPCLPSEAVLLDAVLDVSILGDPAPPFALLCPGVLAERLEQAFPLPSQTLMLLVTRRERELIDAVVEHAEPRLKGGGHDALPYLDLVEFVLRDRMQRVTSHPDFASLGHRFLTLPWRRQVMVLERLGLLRDQDPPMSGRPLFHMSFERAVERGALRHFKNLVDFERDHSGLEHKTAAPSDLMSPGDVQT